MILRSGKLKDENKKISSSKVGNLVHKKFNLNCTKMSLSDEEEIEPNEKIRLEILETNFEKIHQQLEETKQKT